MKAAKAKGHRALRARLPEIPHAAAGGNVSAAARQAGKERRGLGARRNMASTANASGAAQRAGWWQNPESRWSDPRLETMPSMLQTPVRPARSNCPTVRHGAAHPLPGRQPRVRADAAGWRYAQRAGAGLIVSKPPSSRRRGAVILTPASGPRHRSTAGARDRCGTCRRRAHRLPVVALRPPVLAGFPWRRATGCALGDRSAMEDVLAPGHEADRDPASACRRRDRRHRRGLRARRPQCRGCGFRRGGDPFLQRLPDPPVPRRLFQHAR